MIPRLTKLRIKIRYGNWLGGHINLGKKITIYGRNAMHWAVNIRTKRWGYVCFRLPFSCFGHWHPVYLYTSPDGTPQSSTFVLGKIDDGEFGGLSAKRRAARRKEWLGHNFYFDSENNDINDQIRYAINQDKTDSHILSLIREDIKLHK